MKEHSNTSSSSRCKLRNMSKIKVEVKYKRKRKNFSTKRNRLLSSLKQIKNRTIHHRYNTMAQLYQTTVAPLADVANQHTAFLLQPYKAPGMVQGRNLDPNHLVAANLEANILARYHVDNPASVTTDEVAFGLVRSHAIGSEFVAQIYPAAGAPVWFTNALNAALAPIQADIGILQNSVGALQNSVGALQNSVGVLQNSVGALQNSVDSINVRIDNQSIKRLNKARLACGAALTPLKKQVAGRGPGLGNRNVGVRYRHIAVGDPVDVNCFPSTGAALLRLTEDQLSRLSVLYNEDFGIIQGDTIETQRDKFKEFIS